MSLCSWTEIGGIKSSLGVGQAFEPDAFCLAQDFRLESLTYVKSSAVALGFSDGEAIRIMDCGTGAV